MIVGGSSMAVRDTQMAEEVVAHASISAGECQGHVMTETEHAAICTPECSSHHSLMGIPRDEMRMAKPLERPAVEDVEPAMLVL